MRSLGGFAHFCYQLPFYWHGVIERQPASIGVDDFAADVGRIIACEEGRNARNLFRLTYASEWGSGEQSRERFGVLIYGVHHVSVDGTGTDGVDADAVGREGEGHCFCQLIDSAFGCAVRDLVCQRNDGIDRRHVDDASGRVLLLDLFDHLFGGRLRDEESSVEVDLQHS